MADNIPQNAVSASLASIEANIVIAGVEAVTGIWVIYRAHTDQCIIPSLPDTWHWSFSFYAVLGLLGIVVAGFALEAAAGLLERAISRPLYGDQKEMLRKWYGKYTQAPRDDQDVSRAQKWIWKSPQAYQEFTRRRLRILVARNTATFLLLLTVFWPFLVEWSLWLLLGLSGSAMFAWLWFDAQKGWNRAVAVAEKLGEP